MLNARTAYILSFTLLSSLAYAEKPKYGKSHEVHLGETSNQIEKKMDILAKKLDLTPQQLFRAKTALEAQSVKMDQLKKEYADAVSRIIDDTDGEMKGILNPAQQERFSKYREDILGKKEPKSETQSDAELPHDHPRGGS